jgi:hypothetical protein
MAVKTFTTGEVLTAADTNTYLANSGLVYITSATMTGSTSILNMDNIFTSTYDNYRILVQNLSPAASAFFDMRFRSGGVSRITQYQFALVGFTAGGAASNDSSGGYVAQGYFGGQSSFAGDTVNSAWDVFTPFTTNRTTVTFQTVAYPSVFATRSGIIEHDHGVSNDGITIYSSQNFSGKVTVYGYRKA